jgi:hypothetical protein
LKTLLQKGKQRRLNVRKLEQQLQIKVANWIRLRYPTLLWTISPAGLVRGANMAVQMKRMGYTNGTPDILIFEPHGRFHGLFIELKVEGGKVSEDQRKFIEKAAALGYATAVCFFWKDAVSTIDNYLNLPKPERGNIYEQDKRSGCSVLDP